MSDDYSSYDFYLFRGMKLCKNGGVRCIFCGNQGKMQDGNYLVIHESWCRIVCFVNAEVINGQQMDEQGSVPGETRRD